MVRLDEKASQKGVCILGSDTCESRYHSPDDHARRKIDPWSSNVVQEHVPRQGKLLRDVGRAFRLTTALA